jgi:cystathionine beta-synthase
MTDVIARMKEHDISQMPALHPDGSLAGLITELDLLKHIVNEGHAHSQEETIEGIVRSPEVIYPASTALETILPQVLDSQVVLVTEGERPVGILTKIDVLDFIAREI